MTWNTVDLFNPTPEHKILRDSMSSFVKSEVETQAADCDRSERFNLKLFKKVGEMGLLGITADEKHGGSGMDPVAAVIVHEEL